MIADNAPLVLVVEDDVGMTRALGAALRARDYRVEAVPTGRAALDSVAARTPDVVILDLGLPDVDGVDVCRQLRDWTDVPVIVLTAEGSDERKVVALDVGADDYVTKPFSTPELLARVRVALRHRRRALAAGADTVFRVGALEVDVSRHRVRLEGREIGLTPREFGFLAVLARHPGRVITHRAILQEVWGRQYGTETQYLRVFASQLRKKLGDPAAGSNSGGSVSRPTAARLLTEPGVGYRLVDPGDEEGNGSLNL